MEVKVKGVYKHFKGNFYIVEEIATCSETLEKYVVYRALYGDNALWIRPLKQFFEEVKKWSKVSVCVVSNGRQRT